MLVKTTTLATLFFKPNITTMIYIITTMYLTKVANRLSTNALHIGG